MSDYGFKRKVAAAGLAVGLIAAASVGASAKTTLTFSHWYNWPAAKEFLDTSIAKFEKAYPGVVVKQSVIPFGSYVEKLLTMSVAGKAPDVVMVSGLWMGAANGVLTDIDSLVKQGKFDKAVAYDSMWRNTTWKGSAVAVPFGGGVQRALYWNKDMFVKAGMDPDRPPVTWDEFLDAIKRLTVDRNNDGKPEVFGTDWATPLVQMLHVQAGGDITIDNGLGTDFNTTAGVKAFEFLQELGRLRSIGALTDFVAGRAATTTDGPWRLTDMKKAAKFKWGFSHFPVPNKEKMRFYASADSLGVSKAAGPRRSSAVSFVKHMMSEEIQTQLAVAVGFPAMNKKALATSAFKAAAEANPYLVTANELMKHAFAPFPSPRDNDLNTLMDKYRDVVLFGKSDAKKAAADLQNEATKLFIRYKK